MPFFGGGGGGGGSSLPPGADVEVEASGDLAAAIAANSGIYISGDVSVTSTLTLSDTHRLFVKPGVTITATSDVGSDPIFDPQAGSTTYFDCAGRFEIVGEHTGPLFSSGTTGRVFSRGKIGISGTSGLGLGVHGKIEHLEFDLADTSYDMRGHGQGTFNDLRIETLTLNGGGLSCNVILRSMSIGTLGLTTSFRGYSTTMSSEFAVQLKSCNVDLVDREALGAWAIDQDESVVGQVHDREDAGTYHGTKTAGMTPATFGAHGRMVLTGADAWNKVIAPGEWRDFLGESGSKYYTILAPGWNNTPTLENASECKVIGGYSKSSLTFASSFDRNDFVGHHFTGLTLNSGSANHRFTNCYFESSLTLPSGSQCTLVNCRGSLTISSGANCTIVGHEGSITNNDGVNTRVTGSHNSGERWMNNDGRIEFKATSTTDATKTQLFIDASSLQFELNSNDVLHGTLKVTCVRDNQNEATFFIPTFTAKNDGGTTTVSAPGTLAALTPDDSSGTGSTLTLDVEADDTNDATAIYITCNASENWDNVAELTFTVVNN